MYYLSMTKGVVTNGSIDHLRKGNSRRRWDLNLGHIGGGRRVYSPLRHPMVLAEEVVRLHPTLRLL